VNFFSICLFLGILIKRSAFALGALLALYFGEMVTYGMLNGNIFGKNMADQITAYFPLISNMNLIVEPFTRLATVHTMQAQIGAGQAKDYSVHFSSIAISLAWTVIFVLMSYKLLQKRDL
jgi:hypothetical protein